MPTVHFTPNLQKHIDCPSVDVQGETVREALEAVFAQHPKLKGYVLDDQNALRKHVVIFVNQNTITDRQTLSDRISPASEIYVMQALSGG